MIVWGTLASIEKTPQFRIPGEWQAWALNCLGMALALSVFMADTMRVAGQGVEVMRDVLPTVFNWPRFSFALLLMSAPASLALWDFCSRRRSGNSSATTIPILRNETVGGSM